MIFPRYCSLTTYSPSSSISIRLSEPDSGVCSERVPLRTHQPRPIWLCTAPEEDAPIFLVRCWNMWYMRHLCVAWSLRDSPMVFLEEGDSDCAWGNKHGQSPHIAQLRIQGRKETFPCREGLRKPPFVRSPLTWRDRRRPRILSLRAWPQ